jgi:hypothetical protein
MDVHTASNSELEGRRVEIDRKIATDDFGLSWGATRWVSHATEKNKVLKEKEQIDAELLRRRRSGRENVEREGVSPHFLHFSDDIFHRHRNRRGPSAVAKGYGVTSQAALAQFAEIAADLKR